MSQRRRVGAWSRRYGVGGVPPSRLMLLPLVGIALWMVGCTASDAVTSTASSSASIEPSVPQSVVPTPQPPVPLTDVEVEAVQLVKPGTVIAWQPSHQADTGADGWKEYKVCSDIVDRTIAELDEFEHVKAWDTRHGLTGSNNYRPKPSNTEAFDAEVATANQHDATVFISVHNDGGAPSGILGESMPGDSEGARLSAALVSALSADLKMRNRGTREVRLYSLEPGRNKATYRCLLEIGDNAADRALLESPAGRQKIAESLARAIREFDFGD